MDKFIQNMRGVKPLKEKRAIFGLVQRFVVRRIA